MAKTFAEKQYAKKVELAKAYIMLGGNLSNAAVAAGISRSTANDYFKTKMFQDILENLKQSDGIELSPKLKNIINKSMELVQDRLENGDFFYDPRTGKIERKPVSIKDAHSVFKDSLAIKQDIENAPAERQAQQTIQETLQQLAKNFEELAAKQKQKAPVQVTDVLFIKDEGE